ncbi:MAG: GNAT family N-acetyltransferase [Anaerolineae bacterium]|nr:GNAT family N-acetyltransferase [Anaerolineae bacterium]
MSINPEIEIRPVSEDELEQCVALDHTSTTEYVWQVDVTEAQDAMLYSLRMVRLPRPMHIVYPQDSRAMLLDWRQRDFFLVAIQQGQIEGYMNIQLDRGCGLGWVRQLVVHRPRRRQRIGSALLNAAQDWAKSRGLRQLMIETQTKNHPAIAFCQRHGFRLSGFNDRYYPNQDIAVFFSRNTR